MEKLSWHDSHLKTAGVLLLGILLLAGNARASMVGGESGAYLRYPVGAAALAMGGAQSAAPASLASWWNPAVLSREKQRIATLGGGIRPMGQSDGFVSYSFKVPPRVGMGLFLLYRGDPFLNDLYDEDERPLGHAAYTTITGKIALSYYLTRKLSAGCNISIHYAKLPSGYTGDNVEYATASSIGSFDFALSYLFSDRLTLALLLKDTGTRLNWNFESSYDYSVPHDDRSLPALIFGSSYSTLLLDRPFIWNFDMRGYVFTGEWKKLERPQVSLFSGWEWQYWKEFSARLGVGDLLLNGDITSGNGNYTRRFSFRLAGGLGYDMSRLRPGMRLNYAVSTDKVWAGVNQQIDITYSF